MVGGPKSYDTMVQDNPKINVPHNPALKTIITKLTRYEKRTRRKPLVSATTDSNLEHQRVSFRKVMPASAKLIEEWRIYVPIAPKLLKKIVLI